MTLSAVGQQRARISHFWTILTEHEGLTWCGHATVLAVAAIALLLRARGYFLHATFIAEDGKYWFAEAYNIGWLRALFLPHVGYLTVAERIPAGPAMWVPLHRAPLVMMIWGAACQYVPVALLLSRRLERLGSLRFRIGLAAIYWFIPNSSELFVIDTNCMWHLCVGLLLLLLAEPPGGAVQATVDLLLVLIAGLSGPFGILLTPVAVLVALARRTRWSVLLAAVTAATAVVQTVSIELNPARLKGTLGATLGGFVRLFGGDLVLGTTLGSRNWALHTPMILLTVAALLGAAIYVTCFAQGSLEWRLIVAFGLGMLVVSLRAPLVNPGEKGWPVLIALSGIQRYWFLPGLTLLWAGAWCCRAARPRALRFLGLAVLIALPVGMLRDFRVREPADVGFRQQARTFEAAPVGTTMQMPIPPDWTMELHKH